MTGGGFYVISFVSCSSCFMLKFSGHYVIKLLGVWRAQAPPFLAFCTLGHVSPGWARRPDTYSQLAMVPGGERCLYLLFHKKQLQSMKMCSEWNGLELGAALGRLNIQKEGSFLLRGGLAGCSVSSSRLYGPKKGSLHQDWSWHQILCQLVNLHLGLNLWWSSRQI